MVRIVDETCGAPEPLCVLYQGEDSGISDALVNAFCDNSTPREVYRACVDLGYAWMRGEPVYAYESYLGVRVESC